MHFSELKLTQFRNYGHLSASFGPGINAVTGDNGAGKTNVLEAVHYLAVTRGFHRRSEPYALKEGTPYFMVEGCLAEGERSHRVQCSYMPPKGKRMLVDGQALKKMSDHIGRVPVVVVLPNDTELIYGSPGVRRKFMDGFVSQYDRGYLEGLIAYEKALDQRNALLQQFAERGRWDEELLRLWDAELVRYGVYLHGARRSFLEEFVPIFEKYFQLIVSDKERPGIVLESPVEENDAAGWGRMLAGCRDRDRFSQRTSAGVHKEDLVFSINGQGAKHFGSQGQQKTFVMALKFSQYEILARRTGKAPLLLLDDVFDKLDLHRLRAISGILHQEVRGQVFVTDTSLERCERVFSELGEREVRYFGVAAGRLSPLDLAGESGKG